MNVTIARIAKLIQRESADIVQNAVKDSKVGYITITDCEVTNDLSFATIYYSLIGDEERVKVAQAGLESAKGYIRKELSQRIKQIRKMPDLIFKYDSSMVYGDKIDSLLKEIHDKEVK